MNDFLAMGGYAAYVWPAYAVAAAVLIGLLVVTLVEHRRQAAILKTLESLRTPRRNRTGAPVAAAAPSDNGAVEA